MIGPDSLQPKLALPHKKPALNRRVFYGKRQYPRSIQLDEQLREPKRLNVAPRGNHPMPGRIEPLQSSLSQYQR
ncbi:hypothetical protein AAHK20_24400 [Trinickia sp. YCB016]